MDFFQLLFNHLEERHCNNFYQNTKQDADYHKATIQENELNEQYEKLNLSEQHRNVIMQWIDAIRAQESTYSKLSSGWVCNVVFPYWCNWQTYEDEQKISGISWLFQVWNTADTEFLFSCSENFLPLYPLVGAIVPWVFGDSQEKCYNFVTCFFDLLMQRYLASIWLFYQLFQSHS